MVDDALGLLRSRLSDRILRQGACESLPREDSVMVRERAAEDRQLGLARQHYQARDWQAALAAFEAAGGFSSLELEDVERMAWARLWTLAPVADCLDAFERLEAMAARHGNERLRARAALEQARMHAMVDNNAMASACWSRAIAQISDIECSEGALGQALAALASELQGDYDGALALAGEALVRADRVGDETSRALATYVAGVATTMLGDVVEGRNTADSAMNLALAGEVDPIYAGVITCGVVSLYRVLGDWDRARELNEVADRYCKREALCHYPGHCSVFRSEASRNAGELADAAQQAIDALQQAGDWSRTWVGLAYHQLGEAELARGRLDEAEAAFAVAVEHGCDPQPGHAQLQASRGHLDSAVRAIGRFLEADGRNEHAVPVLSAGVTLALAAGQTETADEWSTRLEELAALVDTAAVWAASTQARGEIAVAGGDGDEAVHLLRGAIHGWNQLRAPCHAARCRVRLASVLESIGQDQEALVERRAAREAFERFDAIFDAAALGQASRSASPARRTFSFTDIVGSSELLQAMGDESWARVLAAHDRHLRDLLAEHDGHEVKHEGDGLFVSFDSETAAVNWAVAVQRRLDQQRAEHGFAPHIRIGVHCGEAISYGEDFIGRCVHETARIANAASADQILVSAAAAEALSDVDITANRLLQLKGFDEPHQVFEIRWKP